MKQQLNELCNAGLYRRFTVLAGKFADVLSVYTDSAGNQAIVPPGWTVSGVTEENTIWGKNLGLVIYAMSKHTAEKTNWNDPKEVEILKETYDQLVWVPVGLLEANGTLDGVSFTEKFGRRNYRNNEFSKTGYHEPLDGQLVVQKKSVDMYGGYYITRYPISKDKESGVLLRSVKNAEPWTSIMYHTVIEKAYFFHGTAIAGSHLTFGAEYDTALEWIIETGTKTREEIEEDSTAWGNYWNAEHSPRQLIKTGTREGCCVNNIYDFAGNQSELTQEQFDDNDLYRVIRGGGYGSYGNARPVAFREIESKTVSLDDTGFRLVIHII